MNYVREMSYEELLIEYIIVVCGGSRPENDPARTALTYALWNISPG